MLQKSNQISSPSYKSVIKINGIPILPPLITPERRIELHRLKDAAIEIEKRIRKAKENETNNQNLGAIMYQTNATLEQQLTFSESINNVYPIDNTTLPSINNETYVPFANKNSTLTRNVIDVSEYKDEGVQLFANMSSPNQSDNDLLSASSVMINLVDENVKRPSTDCSVKSMSVCDSSEDFISTQPRVRSNSYTLVSPSPHLLAHFENAGSINIPSKPQQEKSNRKLTYTSQQWSTIVQTNTGDHNNSDYSSTNNISAYNKTDITNDQLTTTKNECNSQQNQIETSENKKILTENKERTSTPVITESVYKKDDTKDSERELLEILNNIPENYSKQIIQLIEKQKEEQQRRLESYEKLKKQLLDNGAYLTPPSDEEDETSINAITVKSINDVQSNSVEISINSGIKDDNELKNDCENSSTDNTFYYTFNSSDVIIDGISPLPELNPMIKFKLENMVEENITPKTSFNILPMRSFDKSKKFCNKFNSGREVILDKEINIQRYLLEQEAASKIGAAARGYLVRRLMRTERVQILIQTIKDALICAMELHAEQSENINESDVELHRRLIQQVSAACYGFHDIFFTLTTAEQMAVIAHDRLRLKEKLKRPLSAGSRRSNSSRSSSTNSRRKTTKA